MPLHKRPRVVDLSGEKGPPDTLTNTPTQTQSSAYDTAFPGTAMDTVAMAMINVQYTVNVCISAVTMYNFYYTIINFYKKNKCT